MANETLELNFLGEMEVVQAGLRAALPPSRKTRALLAYLAVTGRAHRRERLTTMFWERPDDPRGALRWSLSRLRPLVDGPDGQHLVADRETVAFQVEHARIDVRFARALLSRAGELTTGELEAAAALFRGEFLEGLDLPDCPDFQAWCVAEREELRELHAGLRRLLVARHGEDAEAALPHARELVRLSPHDADARASLLRTLVAAGRPREADEAFRAAERALVDALPEALAGLARLWRSLRAPAPRATALLSVPDPPPPVLAPASTPARPAPEGPAVQAPTPATPDAGERKHLTVLCARLEEPPESLELDPELALSRLDPAIDALLRAADEHGGTVSSRHDGGITVLFGAPRALEHHAERACRAALAMREAARAAAGEALALRIGIESGEAVVRAVDGPGGPRLEAVGALTRTAARLQDHTPAWRIGLGPEARRLAEGHIEARDLDGGFELLGHAARSPWQARAARGLTRFVGRETEMALLTQRRDLAGGGRGELAAIVGDPGMGKSRLVHELASASRAVGWTVLVTEGRARRTAAALQPVAGLLRAWAGIEARDGATRAAEKLARALDALDPALAAIAPALLSVLDLDVDDPAWRALSPAQRRRRILDGVRGLLIEASRRTPLMVVIEDLHWVDGETQALLDALVDGLQAAPLMLVVTHRPEYRHDWGHKSYFTQVRLNPLPGASAAALLDSLLGTDPELSEVRDLLIERTGGTPLFLEESVRELVETGVLAGERGAYRLLRPPERLAMPATVRAVIAARIDRLPPDQKGLLQVAAVIGRHVPLDLLEAVAALPELEAGLDALQSAELLLESRRIPEVVYSFKHALTQETAYDSLLRERRRALHVELVAVIEERRAERLEAEVERLAHHALAGGLRDKAVHYLARAAKKAIHRSAHRQALDHLDRALGLLGELPETDERLRLRVDLENAAAVTWMAAKGWGAEEVAAAYGRARELCERLGDRRQLFTVLRGQGQFHMIRGEVATARGLGGRCLELARVCDDPGVRIETHHLFWSNSFIMGDYGEALAHAERGIALYDRSRDHPLTYVYSGHDPGVCCRCFSALALWQQGQADRALARAREALELARALDHPLTTALALWGLAFQHLFRQEPEETLAAAEEGVRTCRGWLLPLLLSQCLFQAGWAQARLGRLDDGIALMREGLDGIERTGAEMGLPYLLALLGEALAARGDEPAGLALVEQALAAAGRRGGRMMMPEMLRLKGTILLGHDPAQARACLAEAIRVASLQGSVLPRLRAATCLARELVLDGERPAARTLLLPLLDELHEGLDTADVRQARALLGMGTP